HTRFSRDWSSDVCSSDLGPAAWCRLPDGGELFPAPGGRAASEAPAFPERLVARRICRLPGLGAPARGSGRGADGSVPSLVEEPTRSPLFLCLPPSSSG